MDFLEEYVSGVLAPWRRMDRSRFNLILLGVTLPGLVLSMMGIVDGSGAALGPLMDMLGSGATPEALQGLVQQAGGGAEAAGFPWGGLLDGGGLLVALPAIMMRWRDTGLGAGMGETGVRVLTALLYVVLVFSFIEWAVRLDIGGIATAAGILQFLGIVYLCTAGSVERGGPGMFD